MTRLTVWEPFEALRRFNESFFDTNTESVWTPRVNITENEKNYEISAELPGVDKDDVKVDLKDNKLTIKGEKKLESKDEKENYIRVERNYGSFERSFYLNNDVDVTRLNASFKDGVLNILLPKKEEAQPKEINIEVN